MGEIEISYKTIEVLNYFLVRSVHIAFGLTPFQNHIFPIGSLLAFGLIPSRTRLLLLKILLRDFSLYSKEKKILRNGISVIKML